jgi:hypothetical protein
MRIRAHRDVFSVGANVINAGTRRRRFEGLQRELTLTSPALPMGAW